MKIEIEISDELIAKAHELSGNKTTDAMIEEALRLYITIGNQRELSDLWGKIEMDDKAFE